MFEMQSNFWIYKILFSTAILFIVSIIEFLSVLYAIKKSEKNNKQDTFFCIISNKTQNAEYTLIQEYYSLKLFKNKNFNFEILCLDADFQSDIICKLFAKQHYLKYKKIKTL